METAANSLERPGRPIRWCKFAAPCSATPIQSQTRRRRRYGGGGLSALDTDRIKAHAFGSTSLFEAWIAEERAGKAPCGHAIITKSYDVRRGMPIIILCDLYIVPEHRRGGLAREMMSAVARRAMIWAHANSRSQRALKMRWRSVSSPPLAPSRSKPPCS